MTQSKARDISIHQCSTEEIATAVANTLRKRHGLNFGSHRQYVNLHADIAKGDEKQYRDEAKAEAATAGKPELVEA